MLVNGKEYRTVWMENEQVLMINQPLLPHQFEIFHSRTAEETAAAIKNMVVRGAGALAIAAAYGMVQVFMENQSEEEILKGYKMMKSTRPTAQNLFYAVDKVYKAGNQGKNSKEKIFSALQEAQKLSDEDSFLAAEIGRFGNELIHSGSKILTHCNAGWLAFADWGTAISPIYFASKEGKDVFVWVDETRPRLQGARLTAWELSENNIPHKIIADNAAAHYMSKGNVDLIITGADRIASNGDTANKIGTLDRAVLANYYHIPFYIAAPSTTIDFQCKKGSDIPIEERDENEVLYMFGKDNKGNISSIRVSPEKSSAANPAFDVTPAELITGFITEKGIYKPNDIIKLKELK